jgi:hypothetical protein
MILWYIYNQTLFLLSDIKFPNGLNYTIQVPASINYRALLDKVNEPYEGTVSKIYYLEEGDHYLISNNDSLQTAINCFRKNSPKILEGSMYVELIKSPMPVEQERGSGLMQCILCGHQCYRAESNQGFCPKCKGSMVDVVVLLY